MFLFGIISLLNIKGRNTEKYKQQTYDIGGEWKKKAQKRHSDMTLTNKIQLLCISDWVEKYWKYWRGAGARRVFTALHSSPCLSTSTYWMRAEDSISSTSYCVMWIGIFWEWFFFSRLAQKALYLNRIKFQELRTNVNSNR